MSSDISYQCPIWRCPYCDEVDDGANTLIAHLHTHIAAQDAELRRLKRIETIIKEHERVLLLTDVELQQPTWCMSTLDQTEAQGALSALRRAVEARDGNQSTE